MADLLVLSDLHMDKDGKLHSDLRKLASAVDLILLLNGDLASQEAIALKELCKGDLWVGKDDGEKKDWNVEDTKILSIYLTNKLPEGPTNEHPEKLAMEKADEIQIDADLLVFGNFSEPVILWGRKKDDSPKTRLVVCPGRCSPFYGSSNTIVLLNVNEGKIIPKVLLLPVSYQGGWRWCQKCNCLFWGHEQNKSKCPKDKKPHDGSKSSNYFLANNDPNAPGEAGWRWCQKCQSLFFAPNLDSNICQADAKAHDFSRSGDYSIILNDAEAPGQKGWRQCKKCHALFYSQGKGVCSKGGDHEAYLERDDAGRLNKVEYNLEHR